MEAYDDPDLGSPLKADYPDKNKFAAAVPGLILSHNLHGIEIDLRASQIAALALWLRCQRRFQEMGLSNRPRISRSNIVCAEPMPGEKEMLNEFTDDLNPKVLGQLVGGVFDKMKLAGEAGSLLRIENELRAAIAEAKKQWQQAPKEAQLTLFETRELPQRPQQQLLFDTSGVTDTEFWNEAEANVLASLKKYATETANGRTLQRRLFADDAARGFAFIDMCQKQFDVILMNPPFGDPTNDSKSYVASAYKRTKHDVYAAFVERAISILAPGGTVGAITSRTGFFLSTFQKWREELLLKEVVPFAFADLGYGVLDTAMVETAAFCLRKSAKGHPAVYFRLLTDNHKDVALRKNVEELNKGTETSDTFSVTPDSFGQIPTSPFCYWVGERIRAKFSQLPPFESEGRALRIGDHPGDGFRWLRLSSEVPLRDPTREWKTYHKGGTNSPYFDDAPLVVDWDSERQTYRDFYGRKGRPNERPSNYHHFLKPGITFPYLPHRRGHFSHVPPGGIFGHASPILQLPASQHWAVCALLNSDPYIGLLHSIMPRGSSGGGQTLKYEVGYVRSVPLPTIDDESLSRLGELSRAAYVARYKQEWTNECRRLFVVPSLCSIRRDSLRATIDAVWEEHKHLLKTMVTSHKEINDICFSLYSIDGEDRQKLEESIREAGSEIAFLDEYRQLGGSAERTAPESDTEFIRDVFSYCIGCVVGRWDVRYASGQRQLPEAPDPFAELPPCPPGMLKDSDGLPAIATPDDYPLRIDSDGLLVDDEENGDDIVGSVRQVLDVVWCRRAEEIEKEACEMLGIKSLRDYFRRPGNAGFWSDHVRRYSKSRRKAPIYWLLQSPRKNYALWLYYHRLDKDILFKALVNYVEPKIRLEENRLEPLRAQRQAAGTSGKGIKKLEKDIDKQENVLSELRDFEEKLRRAADLHLEPDLNDGVVLNIAPLWELVPWKEAKKYWDDLMKGKYEWSSIGKQLRQKGLVK